MNEIKLTFRGQTYVIPASKAFQIGEQVEEIASFAEIATWSRNPRFFKMARCLGAMLRFAGCKASDQDVHAEMMAQMSAAMREGLPAEQLLAGQIFEALMAVLTNGAPMGDGSGEMPEKTGASSVPPS